MCWWSWTFWRLNPKCADALRLQEKENKQNSSVKADPALQRAQSWRRIWKDFRWPTEDWGHEDVSNPEKRPSWSLFTRAVQLLAIYF